MFSSFNYIKDRLSPRESKNSDLPNVNIKYPNGKHFELVMNPCDKRNDIIEDLKNQGLETTTKGCDQPTPFVDPIDCFLDYKDAHDGEGGKYAVKTPASLYECNNPYNASIPIDTDRMINTLRQDCAEPQFNSGSSEKAIAVYSAIGGLILSGVLIFSGYSLFKKCRRRQLAENDQPELVSSGDKNTPLINDAESRSINSI